MAKGKLKKGKPEKHGKRNQVYIPLILTKFTLFYRKTHSKAKTSHGKIIIKH